MRVPPLVADRATAVRHGANLVDLLVDWPRAQHPFRQWAKKGSNVSLNLAQPDRPVRPLEDHRHAVLNGGQLSVGVRGDGGEGVQRLPIRRAPVLPDARKDHGIAVDAGNGKRRVAVRISAPFVVGGRRHQAATLGESRPEHPGGRHRLGPRVDRLASFLQVFGERRNEAPFQDVEMALAVRSGPDDRRVIGRRQVPCRLEVRQRVHRPE